MTQPEALRLAVLSAFRGGHFTLGDVQEAEDELNRLIAQRDALLAVVNKLEYSSDGYIKRYPEESEVSAAIAKAQQ